eukprot:PLAT9864.1.p3 GENE.PLAT9864.1~~PLAT9864.1.p3  ORF type:complete len:191 (+),score=109.55 PLAT9864.1:1051-1623(+)
MASRGASETERLRRNIEEQLERLLSQMEDLEEMKEELEDEEYEEGMADTREQLQEFKTMLDKMVEGDMTLVDELGSVQLAIQAAISNAFKTPEVIKLFARKQPDALRVRLTQLQRDKTLGKLDDASAAAASREVLLALQKLGEELTPEEEALLESSSAATAGFSAADGDDVAGAALLSVAGGEVKKAASS